MAAPRCPHGTRQGRGEESTGTPIVSAPVDMASYLLVGERFAGPAIEIRLAVTNSFPRAPFRSDAAGKTQAHAGANDQECHFLYYRPQHDDNAQFDNAARDLCLPNKILR